MKNWNTLEADENRILTKHYTAGRGGRKIDKVIIHHNAGNLAIPGIWDVWQTRQASATTKSTLKAVSASSCGTLIRPGMPGTGTPTPPASVSNTPTSQATPGASPMPAWRRARI